MPHLILLPPHWTEGLLKLQCYPFQLIWFVSSSQRKVHPLLHLFSFSSLAGCSHPLPQCPLSLACVSATLVMQEEVGCWIWQPTALASACPTLQNWWPFSWDMASRKLPGFFQEHSDPWPFSWPPFSVIWGLLSNPCHLPLPLEFAPHSSWLLCQRLSKVANQQCPK